MECYLGGVLRHTEPTLVSTQEKEMATLHEEQCIVK